MASSVISKLIATAASLQNEVTVAAANINLDFTLIKLEAPAEYKGVSNSLSEVRRENAESGALHRTARKLGALFDGIPPPASNLLSAYGKRVTEICDKANIEPGQKKHHGLFSRFVGADSGSLWAAATSGTNAIAIHLLACMIAGIFDGAQSVALWYQLIERRKYDIESTIGKEMDEAKAIRQALASKQEFSREELASWDNSARSWIQTANTITGEQRDRTLLHTDKAGATVNKLADPYDSVLEAWRDAMISMDSLIAGVPQRVRNGAVLLAVTSWHLYPDLCVLSCGPHVIYQKDPLIPSSGILTIDVEHSGEAVGGVTWSLPLSYLRYYGEPVAIHRAMGVNSSRISMDQFRFVLLGCVLSTWCGTTGFVSSVDDALDLVLILLKALQWPEFDPSPDSQPSPESERAKKITTKTSWIGLLLTAAQEVNDGDEVEKGMARSLIGLGRRWGSFLSDTKSHPTPFFGLSHIPSMFSLLNGPEPRIEYLRVFAKDIGLSNWNCVIRYYNDDGSWEYATIEPVDGNFVSDGSTGYIHRPMPSAMTSKHIRWIPIRRTRSPCLCRNACLSAEEVQKQAEAKTNVLRLGRKKKDKPTPCPCLPTGGCIVECHGWESGRFNRCLPRYSTQRLDDLLKLGEHCLPAYEIDSEKDRRNGQVDFGMGQGFESALIDLAKGSENNSVQLAFYVGDSKSAEILRTGPMVEGDIDPRKVLLGRGTRYLGHYFSAGAIKMAFRAHHFNYYKLTEWFATDLRAKHGSFTLALRTCATANEMYGRLPEATVDPLIVKLSLPTARWMPSSEDQNASPLRVKLSRPQAFACIAMFETGRLLDPEYLRNVFAMTVGNSIFVANQMLADPYEVPEETEIKRVSGNIGKPGLSLLVPPPEPRIRKPNASDWALLSYETFSGKIEDNFWKTSMHLSLTQYQPSLPGLDRDEHYIDEDVALRETLVQVYDGSDWVCDQDIISSLKTSRLSRVVPSRGHSEHKPHPASLEELQDAFFPMVSVDNWEELFTPPLDAALSVVRTAGNWLSRLAAVGISIRLNRYTIILPSDVCWGCVRSHIQKLSLSTEDLAQVVLIL